MASELEALATQVDTTWIIVATVLVMFMQAGFLAAPAFRFGRTIRCPVVRLARFNRPGTQPTSVRVQLTGR